MDLLIIYRQGDQHPITILLSSILMRSCTPLPLNEYNESIETMV